MPLVPVVLPGAKAKSFWSRLRGTGWKNRYLRASPAVWQIELPSLIFGKTLKIPLQQFGKRLGNFCQLGKNQPPARKYTRAAHGWHRGF